MILFNEEYGVYVFIQIYEGELPNENFFSCSKINENYFTLSPEQAIGKYLGAVWELVRSFIIPYVEGCEYKDTWLLKGIRVFGLMSQGFAAHSLYDYINVTRLALSSKKTRLAEPLRHCTAEELPIDLFRNIYDIPF